MCVKKMWIWSAQMWTIYLLWQKHVEVLKKEILELLKYLVFAEKVQTLRTQCCIEPQTMKIKVIKYSVK